MLASAGRPWSKVGAGHARKCARQPLAASQVLCLPHLIGGNVCPRATLLYRRCSYRGKPMSPLRPDFLRSLLDTASTRALGPLSRQKWRTGPTWAYRLVSSALVRSCLSTAEDSQDEQVGMFRFPPAPCILCLWTARRFPTEEGSFLFVYAAQILMGLCGPDPESDPKQKKSGRSRDHPTFGFSHFSGQKRARNARIATVGTSGSNS